jgi:signal peptidase I
MASPSYGKKQASDDGWLWGLIKTFVIALVIALGIRTCAYEPFNIPTGSMIPTLRVGDYILVSKFSYGYSRYSFPFWGLDLFDGRILESEPERGDVIVFRYPANPSEDYVKRLIGLPGDRIQMREGRLYINGELVEREEVRTVGEVTIMGQRETIVEYRETLPNGVEHLIWEAHDDRNSVKDNSDVFVVPEGHYFFLGDNRDFSTDSRYPQVGFVPAENLIGRTEVIWFSLEDAGFFEVWRWPTALRFSRMFSGVE